MEHTLKLEEGDTLVLSVVGYKDKLTLTYDIVVETLLQAALRQRQIRRMEADKHRNAYPGAEMAQAQNYSHDVAQPIPATRIFD